MQHLKLPLRLILSLGDLFTQKKEAMDGKK
jgi:hypothetical protein